MCIFMKFKQLLNSVNILKEIVPSFFKRKALQKDYNAEKFKFN